MSEPSSDLSAPGQSKRKQGRPRGGDPAQTRKTILEAAVVVFAEAGLNGAGTRQIASRAGVTGATVYHHFPTKKQLYEAAVAHSLDISWAAVAKAVQGRDSLREDILAVLRCGARLNEYHPELTLLSLRAQTDLERGEFTKLAPEVTRDVINGIIRRAIQRGELDRENVDHLVMSLQSLMWGSALVVCEGREPSEVLEAMEMLIGGRLLDRNSAGGRF